MSGAGDEPKSGSNSGPGPIGDWADLMRRGARLAAAMARASCDGVEIATTPKREIWRDGKISLHRYAATRPQTLGPMLILHGLFGRQTITDLEPERSLVRRLLAAGADLWVLDWGCPTRADRCNDFADYALYWLGDAIEAIRAETGAPQVALFGICQGGVFALCHAALRPERVSGLALAVTPVDFHADAADPSPQAGFLNLWARNLDPAVLDAFLAERGLVPGTMTGAVFQSLTPSRVMARYGTELIGKADDDASLETFLRMEAWLADRPDHPAAAAREWLVDLYRRNALVAGEFALDGERVDLGRIACPILNIVAQADHIVPPPCSRALAGRTASREYRLLEVPTGHIGVFVSEKARGIVAPAVADWLAGLAAGGACRAASG